MVTVVVSTYNRADLVGRTLTAVLAQAGCDFRVIVVDDGSTDGTDEVVAGFRDPRLRVIRKVNAGLGASRNTGLAAVETPAVVFLDDDDVPQPGWLATLVAPLADAEVGVSCVGAVAVHPDGRRLAAWPVVRLSGLFDGVVGSYRAGTFAVRTELCRAAGGFLVGLGTSHQFELFLRLVRVAHERGLRVAATDANLLHIEWRPVDERRSSDPHVIYDATTWVMTRHQDVFRHQPDEVAAFEGVRGAAAARFGDWRATRRHFRTSARLRPRRARHWGRLALAAVPLLGDWAWHRHRVVEYDPTTVGVPVQAAVAEEVGPGEGGPRGRSRGGRAGRPGGPGGEGPGPSELFLAWGYKENFSPLPLHDETPGRSTERLARRLARRHRGLVVEPRGLLERHPDPVAALHGIAGGTAGRPVLLVAADREACDPTAWLGPPADPRHRREWSHDQLVLLLRSTGFTVDRSWRRGDDMAFLVHARRRPPTRVN